MAEQDHYAVLRLTARATDAEIKRSYRTLMREVHPDANVGDPDATRKAARINRAYRDAGRSGEAASVRCRVPRGRRRPRGGAGFHERMAARRGAEVRGMGGRTRLGGDRRGACAAEAAGARALRQSRRSNLRRSKWISRSCGRRRACTARSRSRITATAPCAATSRRPSRGCGARSARSR